MNSSDLTAYARIRNTALRLFAERGVAASSIRMIAKAAGVSPGLVQHHFKTKADLQAALESHITQKIVNLAKDNLTDASNPAKLIIGRKIIDFIRENPDVIQYARRLVLEDSAYGRRLVDQIFAAGRVVIERLGAQGYLRGDVDMEWASANAVMMTIGPLLLEPGLDRFLRHPFRGEEGLARWDVAVDAMLRHGIYRDQPPINETPLPKQESARAPRPRKRSQPRSA